VSFYGKKTYGEHNEDIIKDLIITNNNFLIAVESTSLWGDAWGSIRILKLDCNGNNISYFFKGEINYNLVNSIILTDDSNFLVVGALVVTILTNGLTIMGVTSYWQQISVGFVLIGALGLKKFQK
jgi:hypothetical protein